MNEGRIHLYLGDGKGKTTAATGLAARAVGCGRRVVFAQFLKGSRTGEVSSLEALGVKVVRSEIDFGFCWEMDGGQRETCHAEQERLFGEARRAVMDDVTDNAGEIRENIFGASSDKPPNTCSRAERPADLLVLDEALDVVDVGMLDEETLKGFVMDKPEGLELVLTGRTAPGWLMEEACYITEMKKIKHPYDLGVKARKGIEY